MSIQTELTRITNAKAAIKTAIEGKGVTVPDGTKLDALAALVEAISAGGGTLFNRNWETGSFTPAEDITSDYTINFENAYTSGGSVPYYTFFMWRVSNESVVPNGYVFFIGSLQADTRRGFNCFAYSSTTGSLNLKYSTLVAQRDNAIVLRCTANYALAAGNTYNWIAIGNDEI